MISLDNFKEIKYFVLDIDGVLTDSTLLIDPQGNLQRKMNIKDGYALQLAIAKGYEIIILSGGKYLPIQKRMEGLGIKRVFLGVADKVDVLNDLVKNNIISLDKTLYMGDDMPDFYAIQKAFIAACPADACMDIKAVANYISPIKGGEGCVREVIEKVLKLNGDWE